MVKLYCTEWADTVSTEQIEQLPIALMPTALMSRSVIVDISPLPNAQMSTVLFNFIFFLTEV